jgi:hypothetical protein
MAVGGHDQVGLGRDFRRGHAFRIGLHDDLDPGGPRSGGKPVLAVVNDDADDIDPVLTQRVECRHAEMAGTDQGDPHVFYPSLIRPVCR